MEHPDEPSSAREPPNFGLRYKNLGRIGAGSMGAVYRAMDQLLGHEVAIKVLHDLDIDALVKLKQEFRGLQGLKHPGLVPVLELETDTSPPFFTMELIQGVDLYAWARKGEGELDAGTVCDVAVRIVEALDYLHRNGVVHRDVKPSNILVRHDGQPIIVDFGLVKRSVQDVPSLGPHRGLSGTVDYLPPEALERLDGRGGPERDWFALAVTLYQIIYGAPPFVGDGFERFSAITRDGPNHPGGPVQGYSGELLDCIRAMLAPTIANRAPPKRLIAALRANGKVTANGLSHAATPTMQNAGPSLIGRDVALESLERAASVVDEGELSVVSVTGESGIGKTALVEAFARQFAKDGGILLRSACHPNERIRYNAIDGAMDALSACLRTTPELGGVRIDEQGAADLVRLFPVLGNRGSFDVEPVVREDLSSPQDRRMRAFRALRDLLGQVANHKRVAFWVDDAQWADVDSLRLLAHIFSTPVAPPVLLILTHRPVAANGAGSTSGVPDLLRQVERATRPRARLAELHLPALDESGARSLAERTLREFGAPETHAESIATLSRGVPFFIRELGREVAQSDLQPTQVLPSFEEIVARRLSRLGQGAAQVLSVVAAADKPLHRATIVKAARVGPSGLPSLIELDRLGLTSNARTTELNEVLVEIYHLRLKNAVLAWLKEEALNAAHASLADTMLEGDPPDYESAVHHLLVTGQGPRAAEAAVQAAQQASSSFAFEHAARLYDIAIANGKPSSQMWRLHEQRGQALSNAGLPGEAAKAYKAAASLYRGDENDLRRMELERRSAEELLHAGSVQEGMGQMAALLSRLRIRLPTAGSDASRFALVRRLRFLLYRDPVPKKVPLQEPPIDRLRMDVLWTIATSTSHVAPAYSDAAGVLHLLEAIRRGSKSRVVRALSFEAAFEAFVGGTFFQRRSDALIRRLAELTDQSPTRQAALDRAFVHLSACSAEMFRPDWLKVIEHAERAEEVYLKECVGGRFELGIARCYRLYALATSGQFSEVRRFAPEWIASAQQRGDAMCANQYRQGHAVVAWLASDDVSTLHAFLADAARSKTWAPDGFGTDAYQRLTAEVQLALYMGDGDGAHKMIEEAWPSIIKAQFLKAACVGAELRHMRGRAALACLGGVHDSIRQSELVQIVRTEQRALQRSSLRFAQSLGGLLQAGLDFATGHREEAEERLAGLQSEFTALGMGHYAAACAALIGRRDPWLDRGEHIEKPDKFFAMLVPTTTTAQLAG